ncbi:MAG: hypothetical protein Q4A29_01525 [Eubacteriales bacterium]|nr:hypothetical protein [Eubacteriales bacterium]
MRKNPFVITTKDDRIAYKKFKKSVKRYAERTGQDYESAKDYILFGNASRQIIMGSPNKRTGYTYQGLKKED